MTDVVVIFATVEWRAENAERLARDVIAQGAPLIRIFDGWNPTHTPGRYTLGGGNGYWVHNPQPRGAGHRWRVIAGWQPQGIPEINDRTVVIVLDDDMRIGPNYVSRCVAALLEAEARHNAIAISWWGTLRGAETGAEPTVRLPLSWFGPETPAPEGGELLSILHAGSVCLRAGALRGFDEHPLADEYLGLKGDDEAFVSWRLQRMHGRPLVRPNNPPDVSFVQGVVDDPRAQYRRAGSRYWQMRWKLAERGWPELGERPVNHGQFDIRGVEIDAQGRPERQF